MARFYSNENTPLPVVAELRRLGHDVLTSLDAGNANVSVPDADVLAFAARESRILLTHNRRDLIRSTLTKRRRATTASRSAPEAFRRKLSTGRSALDAGHENSVFIRVHLRSSVAQIHFCARVAAAFLPNHPISPAATTMPAVASHSPCITV